MLLEMLLLHKLEEAVCHSFCCALTQGYGMCLVAVIVMSQLQILCCGVLCDFCSSCILSFTSLTPWSFVILE